MIQVQGTPVSGGCAEGILHFLCRREPEACGTSAGEPAAEWARFEWAQRLAIRRCATLAERCRAQGDAEAAELLGVHALLLEDEEFAQCVRQMLEEERFSAAHAVQSAGERFAGLLAASGSDYMQARAADVRDVTCRLLESLTDGAPSGELPGAACILAAEELLPSQAVQLDRTKVLGVVLCGGSPVGHTAILLRTMGIPAIFGVGTALRAEFSGQPVLLDGDAGSLVIGPDAGMRAAFRHRRRLAREEAARWDDVRGLPDVTRDGRPVEILCNMGLPDDVGDVLANDGRGIGLFRTEFLCLAAGRVPDEEAQYRACREVARAMGDRRVVIRTLDLGADKRLPGLDLPMEENPALGLRGVRLCLQQPELFRTQLRALYRASAHGRIAILLPMITSLWELRACRELCRDVMTELAQSGVAFRQETELGVMIETPAAVLIARELAAEADFLCVGANDLTQYLLACDRQSAHLQRFCDPHHPAVLTAIRMTAEAAHRAGKRVSICGDLAADETALPALTALGVDALSVPAGSVLRLRAALRKLTAAECRAVFPQQAGGG